MTTDLQFLSAHRSFLREPEPHDLDREEQIELERGDQQHDAEVDRLMDDSRAHRPGGENERDFMTDGNVNEVTSVQTDQAQPGSGTASGSAFRPTPGSLWLVVVECRYNVIVVSSKGDGFFIPGQEPCWRLAHVQEWVKEIIPPPRSANPAIQSDHPEATCDDCGGANVIWFAPNSMWNKIIRNPQKPDPMLCPRCFILRAEVMGIHEAWVVTQAESRVYD